MYIKDGDIQRMVGVGLVIAVCAAVVAFGVGVIIGVGAG